MALNWTLVAFVKRSKNRLEVLKILESPMTPSEIAKKLKISLTHASKIIRELNSKKLVKCLNEQDKLGRLYERVKEVETILKFLSKK